MRIKKIIASVSASAMLCLSIVGVASANHNQNGSFEDGTDPGVFTTLFAGDSTNITGWTVVSGSVDYIGTYWQSFDGARSLDMSGNDAGAISKTFPTVVGHTYNVSFDLAGNPDVQGVKTLNVDTGGAVTTYTFDSTGRSLLDMGWDARNYSFTATSHSTTLTFTSMDNSFWGPALDNVVVTNVLTNKEQCKKDGWKAYTNPAFKNQGDCVSYIQSNPNATGNRANNPVF